MSVTVNECLKALVGISQSDCSCYTDKPEDFNDSSSGLYLDQLFPLPFAKALESCEDGDLWEILEQARAEGIIRFIGDLYSIMSDRYERALNQFKGKIGETKGNTAISTGNTYAGLMIYCKDLRGATLTIEKIGTLFEASGIKNVTIYDNLGNSYGTINLTTTASAHYDNTLSPSIQLDLHSDDVENIIYYIVYQVDANRCLNNQIACTSCSKDKLIFNTSSPYFYKPHDRRYFWACWVMVGGFTVDSLDQLWDDDTIPGVSNNLYGLTVDIKLDCDGKKSICLDDAAYEHPQQYITMAECIRWKSFEFAVDKILKSDKLNRVVMLNREQLIEKVKEYNGLYAPAMAFLADAMDFTNSDCLRCKEPIKARVNKPF